MIYEHIVSREPIDKGWSGETKYRILDEAGNTCLLRVAPTERYERKAAQFHRMEAVAALGIPMCLPIEFGACPEGAYTILSWVSGHDAEAVIPALPKERQYAYGLDAGRILRKIHSLPAPANAMDWADRFNQKIDRKLAMYERCPLKYDSGSAFLDYLAGHRQLLEGRPQTYQHGDYHIGNMMIDDQGVLTVIDFEKDDWGDPWEEFNRIVWSAQCSPTFASGMVDGYFGCEVPQEFWDLLALYICSNTLGSLPWAIPFGQTEIDTMRRQAAEILQWYDSLNTTVPNWYHSGIMPGYLTKIV